MNKFSLDKHPKVTSGFKVSEDYFDNLPNIILEKITKEQPIQKKENYLPLKTLVMQPQLFW